MSSIGIGKVSSKRNDELELGIGLGGVIFSGGVSQASTESDPRRDEEDVLGEEDLHGKAGGD